MEFENVYTDNIEYTNNINNKCIEQLSISDNDNSNTNYFTTAEEISMPNIVFPEEMRNNFRFMNTCETDPIYYRSKNQQNNEIVEKKCLEPLCDDY